MSSHSNEYAFTREFVGDLRMESQSVPVEVNTRVRVANKPNPDDIRQYGSRKFDKAPQYVFGGGNLPLHPSLKAMGRHYFTW